MKKKSLKKFKLEKNVISKLQLSQIKGGEPLIPRHKLSTPGYPCI